MATDVSRHSSLAAEAPAGTAGTERHHKGRKPFSSLMKRLASLKSHSTSTSSQSRAANGGRAASCSSQSPYSPYYPYKSGKPASPPPSTSASAAAPSHISFGPNHHGSTHSISSTASVSSTASGEHSLTQSPSEKSRGRPAPSAITATTATTSAFSSPTPSVRSLTTTLTTIQSTAPGSLLDPYPHYNPHPSHHHNPNAPPMLFQHQFPSSPSATLPASPGPVMALNNGTLHPINYSTATAGGLLTDNASIITLASSSKRRRRHSLDTDASVRALAPSSLWGGSRESLPLSVLSGNFDMGRSIAGDRGSIYGSTSFSTARGGDAASMNYAGSMRDFVGGSGSIMGEISGAGQLCASPHTGMSIIGNRESMNLGRGSRRNSGWVRDEEEEEDIEDDDATDRRRSMSANGDVDEGEGRGGDGASMRDGSSSVGVWHGVFGKREDVGEKEKRTMDGGNEKQ